MYHRSKSIREMPQDLKPREKLLRLGVEKLTEEELLAIVLGSGTKDMDVLSLSRAILRTGWQKLHELTPQELMEGFKGIGEARACQIKAIVELARRINDPYEGVFINGPEDAYKFLKEKVDDRKEHLLALYLSPTNRLLSYEVIAIGRMNALHAEPKEILYHAINSACYGILIAHNHPKGQLKPSREDLEFTKRVREACKLMGFELLDHLIINLKGYLSMKKEGYL
ncbi:MAG: DNA repair protein RadC [Aquificaceae bacterium]|nr:DNA repair protein RadC [Aquificaceae bacterium]MCS7196608.1 DNA repair protein RadC [Aquificaceae bacterium]MCX7989460.1 DNA repair protein RadC [Aquificaceae bacterium]MDW8031972.1 DNA repair protein RadC [Aquificaceae bacterium]MDW8294573.1 DNA repair protein RadC [Aquificaceae bacterium]